jgi:NAD(P)-dependent dehydrogenase (short-subunit alcohol dehydrogenase family)
VPRDACTDLVGRDAMSGLCDGRVAIVTGAGRGLGRAHALALGREGAQVVVNDLGVELDGSGGGSAPAQQVVDEIRSLGGDAVTDGNDISEWDGAGRLIETAQRAFGRLDILVNNAGVLRDRMVVSMQPDDVGRVIDVHLKGTIFTSHHAAAHWRDRAKAGDPVDARIVNTTSGAGLYGNIGQGAYSAAKAGIVGFTLVAAAELARYGVTANALSPGGRTRMTEQIFSSAMATPEEGAFDGMDPENVSPVVAWLGSAESAGITGRVFEVYGGMVGLADGWHHGPEFSEERRLPPAEIGVIIRDLLARAAEPEPVQGT